MHEEVLTPIEYGCKARLNNSECGDSTKYYIFKIDLDDNEKMKYLFIKCVKMSESDVSDCT